jgi:CBS domain-containing protein
MPAWSIEGSVRSRARPNPLTVPPELPLVEVCRLVRESGEEFVVIVDRESQLPLGSMSLHDLIGRLVDQALDREAPVAGAMTAGLVTLPADAPSQAAATLMVRRGVRHVVLVEEDGRFAGVLSRRHLYSMQGGQVESLVQRVSKAATLDDLTPLASEVRQLAGRLLDEGMRAEAVCHWVSVLNDLIAVQVIDVLEPRFDLPVVPWTWLLFGSEGRLEQTLVTDQDNGIVFVPPDEADAPAMREAFLPFARAVNEALDRCGFPLCQGEVMASNPKWCLSLDEWKAAYREWTRAPEPGALLNASIFFDFRGLFGAEEPVRQMRSSMLSDVRASPLCLRLMAQNALAVEPPVGGWWRPFRYDDAKHPRSLDLKKYGSRIFVDAARVLALNADCADTGTVPRLLAVAEKLNWPPGDVAALIDGFYVLQRLRLQHQAGLLAAGSEGGAATDSENRVRPETLHALDRQLLREALRMAGSVQFRLRRNLHLGQ